MTSDLQEAAQRLLDAFHQGRLVPLDEASDGYVQSVVDAAEEALAAALAAPAAQPGECPHLQECLKEGCNQNLDGAPCDRTAPASPRAEVRAAQDALPWRCFHCNEIFTDRDAAREHFGTSEHQQAWCDIDVKHVRWLEEQHRLNCDEITPVMNGLRGLAGEHETLRRRAEEEGYAKGLADARKHPEELGLVAALAQDAPQGEPVAWPEGDLPWPAIGYESLRDECEKLVTAFEMTPPPGHPQEEWWRGMHEAGVLLGAALYRTRAAAPPSSPASVPQGERIQLLGIKGDGKEHDLGTMPEVLAPKFKMREIVQQYFGTFEHDDGSDADMAMAALEEFQRWYKAGLDALTAPAPPAHQAGEGWRLVPVEPTTEMWAAWRAKNCEMGDADNGMGEFTYFRGDFGQWAYNYAAMLAAAPVVPEPAAVQPFRDVLQKITRIPVMPFPDPGAHSERAFSDAVWRAWNQIQQLARTALSDTDPPPAAVQAHADVLAERRRQVSVEGWTAEHDDGHVTKYGEPELPIAAACYAMAGIAKTSDLLNAWWPWDIKWWKPGSPRRNLVKAGALILAEIERLDRAAPPPTPEEPNL